MSYSVFNNIRVAGTSVAVPENIQYNREEAQILGVENVERFINVVGVEQRHIAINGQTSSDLCYEAAYRLLDHLCVDRNTIDALIFVTQTPDYIQPATSYILHNRLGLQKHTIAFDINLGCSGFVYGLTIASSLICGMGLKRVLLLVGDILRKNEAVDKKDALLFGDVGTATLVEAGEGKIESALFADGRGYTNLIIPGGGTRRPYQTGDDFWKITKPEMDGESVMSFTITEVPKAFKEMFKQNGKSINDYDLCLLHQANKQMVNYIAKKLKISANKLPMTMNMYGNTNGSSVLVSLAEACSHGELKDKVSIIASGYGIGLSWGVVTFEIETKNVLPVVKTSLTFEEAYRGEV